jgi:predicted MFS family arabinose efflux permease
MFVVGTDLFVASPLLPGIAGDFAVSPELAGLSVTAFSVTYMFGAPLLGQIADRVGRRRMLIRCLLLFAVANLLTAASGNFTGLVAARILAGAMTAGVSPSVYALVGNAAPPERRGTWMAIAVSGLLMSLAVGAPLGALLGAWLGWARVFAVLAGLSLVLVWANYRAWPAETVAPQTGSGDRDGWFALALAQRLAPTVVWATALYGIYTYLGTWLIHAGFTAAEVAQVITFYGGGAILGTLAGGRMADRFGAKITTATSLFGLAASFLLLPLLLALRPGLPICLGFGLTSAVAQLFFPAQQAGLVAAVPSCRATVLAWNNSALFLGIAFGSLVGGQAIAFGSFGSSLSLCAAIALAGAVINLTASPRLVASASG